MNKNDDILKRYASLSPEKRELLNSLLKKEHLADWELPLIPKRVDPRTALLSPAQMRLWFLSQLDAKSAAYNVSTPFRLTGPLHIAALEWSLNEIIKRHEILRTTFATGEGQPVQIIASTLQVSLPVIDVTGVQQSLDHLKQGQELMEEEAQNPFNLLQGPLIRLFVVKLAREEYLLLITMHHIITDGWSLGIFFKELSAFYTAYPNRHAVSLTPLSIQYSDFACWQQSKLQGDEREALVAYWRKQLKGCPTSLTLPTDRPRPPLQTFRGASLLRRLPQDLSRQLMALSQREGTTPFMLLLAAFATLLHRYTGQRDIVMGSPSANRSQTELEGLIGFFVNILVLRMRCSDTISFRELVKQVRETTLEAYTHQDLPFDQLVKELHPERDASYTPWTQVHFAFQNVPKAKLEFAGFTLEPVDTHQGTTAADLIVEVSDNRDEFLCSFTYNTDLFEGTTIERMAVHFQTLLENILLDPEQPLSRLQFLTPTERYQLVSEWNTTDIEYSQSMCIHQLFEKRAELQPEAIAIIFGEEYLTYAELNRRANQVGHYLQRFGVGPDTLSGLCVERSPKMVIGLLGILKAGGGYVPLDPNYPKERLAFLLEDAGISVLVAQAHVNIPPVAKGVQIISLDHNWSEITHESALSPSSAVTARHLAYVMYTSGSTGRPKGVMIEHRNVLSFFKGMDMHLGSETSGTWLAVTNMSFDISVLELFWTLLKGFRVIIQRHQNGLPLFKKEKGKASRKRMEFSLFYFANDAETSRREEKYRLLLEGAKFADRHGFSAVWTPERHFHPFGGLYPNPSITSAALATITRQIKIRAGSVVLPLHNPVRVAEEWAVVDNLSGGRVALSFASGWQVNDFVLAPERYSKRRKAMLHEIETICKLWRGERITLPNGLGNEVEVEIFPRPIQRELPIWITSAGSPESFKMAGEMGANLLTHLLGQNLSELAEKIALYRDAWRKHGHASGGGHVTLMLHTFVGEDREAVREKVRGPFCSYLKSSFSLLQNWLKSLERESGKENLSQDDLDALLTYAFERYAETSGLIGTPSTCLAMIDHLKEIDVDEVACLIDFGLDTDSVLAGLEYLDQVKIQSNEEETADEMYPISVQIQRHHISHLQCTPSLIPLLTTDEEIASIFGRLQKLLIGGEAFPLALAEKLSELTAGETYNMYGPTETTIWSTAHLVGKEENTIPIGRPLANTRVYILDPSLQLLPVGVAGEVYIGGEGIARGYFNRPDLTAEKFLPDPFTGQPGRRFYKTGDIARYRPDGSIEYLGRNDQQIKIRGLRLELEEIEAVLRQHPLIQDCIVTAQEGPSIEKYLVAYIVLREHEVLSSEKIRAFLLSKVPMSMIPSRFLQLEKLPLTPNGKVDRQALLALDLSAQSMSKPSLAPRDPIEERLVEVWMNLFGVKQVGIQDNFFDLGGHSLLALRLIHEIQNIFQQSISLSVLLQEATIEHLAQVLRQGDDALLFSSIVAIQPQGKRQPFFCVHPGSGNILCYRELAYQLGTDQPLYGIQDPDIYEEAFTPLSIEKMAARYVKALRTIQPEGPYILGGYSFGGCVAFEMAKQIQALDQEIAHLIIFEGIAPAMPSNMDQDDDALWLAILTLEMVRGSSDKGISEMYADLKQLHLKEQLDYVLEQMQRAKLRIEERGTQWIYHQMQIFKYRDLTLQNYRPSAYSGKITLFLSKEKDDFSAVQLSTKNKELIQGWSQVSTQELEVEFAPGYHDTLLKAPCVSLIASKLQSLFSE